jgi:hypothetical protein
VIAGRTWTARRLVAEYHRRIERGIVGRRIMPPYPGPICQPLEEVVVERMVEDEVEDRLGSYFGETRQYSFEDEMTSERLREWYVRFYVLESRPPGYIGQAQVNGVVDVSNATIAKYFFVKEGYPKRGRQASMRVVAGEPDMTLMEEILQRKDEFPALAAYLIEQAQALAARTVEEAKHEEVVSQPQPAISVIATETTLPLTLTIDETVDLINLLVDRIQAQVGDRAEVDFSLDIRYGRRKPVASLQATTGQGSWRVQHAPASAS